MSAEPSSPTSGEAWLAVVSGLPVQLFALGPGEFVAGRAQENAVALNHVEVSRRHCRIAGSGSQWIVEDLGSQWGTLVDGAKTDGPTPIGDGTRISLGPVVLLFGIGALPDEARFERLKREAIRQTEASTLQVHGRPAQRIPLSKHLSLGRDPQGDVVLNDPAISRRHAIIKKVPSGYRLIDLRSTAGSFVNGHRFDEHDLTIGDRIQFGPFYFEFDGGSLNRVHGSGGGEIKAESVTVRIGQLTILQNISLLLAPCEFVGIIGPSGAGKSTLLGALSGMREPTAGRVLVNRTDVYRAAAPGAFGYVPQEDIVHPELTVAEALEFSAKLRLSRQTPISEIRKLVVQTMDQLGLSERANTRIMRLSGGQRKRVSVGVELLARPPVLFLDEPSSGLDPATEFKLMELLRELADTGCTIVCTTHVMENAYLMDKILVVCRGHLVFDGSPQDTRAHFDVPRLAGLYDRLDERPAVEWAQAFEEERQKQIAAETGVSETEPVPQRLPKKRRALPILLHRQWAILVSDWRNFAILLGQPLVIGALVGWASDDVSLVLFFAYIATLWFGCSNGAQEIVREIPVYRRERIVGVGRNSYLVSKYIDLLAITLVQACLLYGTLQMVEGGLAGAVLWQLGGLVGISFAAVGIGLAISSLARSVMQSVMIVPLLLIPLILFSGFTVPAFEMRKEVAAVSAVTPTFASQQMMDTSFLWKKQIARTTLSDHWTSFRNLNRDEKLKTGQIYEDLGKGLGSLFVMFAWAVVTYCVALFALRAREKT